MSGHTPGNRLRLASSEGIAPSTEYLTLSHCWGMNMPLRLTAVTFRFPKRVANLGIADYVQ